ncbi:class I SAM-dependent methyltransferase [Phragmitibacter flavus]|uniref:Class I SAM-dependent methyltransferase n=1 Tax=Phragmitibacter flavus TaxID=2576071 RepID=A0A5R8K7C9_9BACT|nr:class I SAM-dependent methyltransferase [Phragmitibacter flavus]TLD68267.1 class I SAM-dependent methyltransferase [Phragmitibacter flavus]
MHRFTFKRSSWMLGWFALAGSMVAIAEEIPPPVDVYMGRTVAQTMHFTGASWLVRHKRDREEAATLMREKLELKPGMMVCDLGCGNGYHTFPMAMSVAPEGKVYGVEIQEPYLDMLEERAKKLEVKNFVPVLGAVHDPKLPADTFDMILMVDVYHEFSHPEHMLKALHRALKPGGSLVLVEYRAEDESVPIKPEHKMSKEQILKELTANGYQLTKEFNELPWQHMMWFSRAEAKAP